MAVENHGGDGRTTTTTIGCHEMSTCHESSGAETDQLSALPREIINIILSYLSIDDVLRTRILSKKWRHMWKTIPDIVFDTECFAVTDDKVEAPHNEQKLEEAISWALENHSGEIISFYVRHPNLNPVDDVIHQWIKRLSGCPIELFSLDLCARRHGRYGRYKVHPSLLKLKGLTMLELWRCSIEHFPTTFGRLQKLKYLQLFWTPMSHDGFEYLIKSCPLLEVVEYRNMESYFPILKIQAPRLISFTFTGVFDQLIFTDVDNLTGVSISMDRNICKKSEKVPPVNACNLSGLFWSLAKVHTLHIKSASLKYLIHRYIPERLSTPFPNITWLAVETDPMCKQEIEGILCMLKSLPCLERLTILFRGDRDHDEGTEKYFLEDKCRGLELLKVRLVEAVEFSDCFSELNLLEFILLACMNLKRLSVVDSISSKGKCPIEETTRRLRLVSGQAKATILRRESCQGTCPTLVYMWLNDLNVRHIPACIIESPPDPQVI